MIEELVNLIKERQEAIAFGANPSLNDYQFNM